jgi:hypothetical protein
MPSVDPNAQAVTEIQSITKARKERKHEKEIRFRRFVFFFLS